jgi:enoyl-CoA hydratase
MVARIGRRRASSAGGGDRRRGASSGASSAGAAIYASLVSERVSYTLSDRIATITMDDGKVNVLSPAMLTELSSALDRAADDGAVVLITGREGVFSAGFDLRVFQEGGEAARSMLRNGLELAVRLLSFPAPVVVACGGHALAMGSFLLLSADYRVGADGAFKIGANEVAIGMTVPRAAIEICRLRLSPVHFPRAVLGAEIYSPAAAVDAGFLDAAVPPGELLSAAQSVAARFAMLELSAYARTKSRARDAALSTLRSCIDADDAEMAAALAGSGSGSGSDRSGS